MTLHTFHHVPVLSLPVIEMINVFLCAVSDGAFDPVAIGTGPAAAAAAVVVAVV